MEPRYELEKPGTVYSSIKIHFSRGVRRSVKTHFGFCMTVDAIPGVKLPDSMRQKIDTAEGDATVRNDWHIMDDIFRTRASAQTIGKWHSATCKNSDLRIGLRVSIMSQMNVPVLEPRLQRANGRANRIYDVVV